MGQRIEQISGCSATAYTPNKYNSDLVINNCAVPELYYHSGGGVWVQLNASGSTYTAGTGIAISGSNVISNTGDLSATNELNTAALVTGGNLRITDAGGNLDVAVTSIAPVQAVAAGTGISISGTTTRTISSTITQADGSETIVNAGTGVSVSGAGTSGSPYVVTNTGDLSTTNELQTIANTSDATSHTLTLSNTGGSVQLVEGSGVTLTTTGTSGAGVVTIAASGSGIVPIPDVTFRIEGASVDAQDGAVTDTDEIQRVLELTVIEFYLEVINPGTVFTRVP